MLVYQAGQKIPNQVTPWSTDDVTDKEDFQNGSVLLK
jgi:hypothetical protein